MQVRQAICHEFTQVKRKEFFNVLGVTEDVVLMQLLLLTTTGVWVASPT